MCPHMPPDCKGSHGMSSDIKKAETLVFIGGSGLSGTALELEMVEVGGTSNGRHLSQQNQQDSRATSGQKVIPDVIPGS